MRTIQDVIEDYAHEMVSAMDLEDLIEAFKDQVRGSFDGVEEDAILREIDNAGYPDALESYQFSELPDGVEIARALDGQWIVVQNGFQKGGTVQPSGAGDKEFDTYMEAVDWAIENLG